MIPARPGCARAWPRRALHSLLAATACASTLVLLGCASAVGAGSDHCEHELCSHLVQDGPRSMSFVVENRTAMPVVVRAAFPDLVNVRPSRPVPVEKALAPGERAVLVRFAVIVPGRPSAAASRFDAIYGSPASRHDDATRYAWPFGGGEPRMLAQGVGGAQSHQGANRYSFDFSLPEGTPVLAARAGVVVLVKDGFERSGLDPALEQQANTVVVLHDDESFASYGHLLRGIEVNVGQKVERGEQLGRSGSSGYAAGPHLHFQVGMVLERYDDRVSVPVRFDDPRVSVPIRFDDGSADGVAPEEGRWYGPGSELR